MNPKIADDVIQSLIRGARAIDEIDRRGCQALKFMGPALVEQCEATKVPLIGQSPTPSPASTGVKSTKPTP